MRPCELLDTNDPPLTEGSRHNSPLSGNRWFPLGKRVTCAYLEARRVLQAARAATRTTPSARMGSFSFRACGPGLTGHVGLLHRLLPLMARMARETLVFG